MGISPSHRFGQIIGEVVETAVIPLLEEFAKNHGLYLDKNGRRPCRDGLKCTWIDLNGNAHDLDFVLERGGSLKRKGVPAAFIETAWRRYTKHSRNKVQEIQGAILPLVETYQNAKPFIGVILAGEFTEGALNQLKSLGFTILFIPYEVLLDAFNLFGIDAAFDEDTPDSVFKRKVSAWERLSKNKRTKIAKALLDACEKDVKSFIISLEAVVLRQIAKISILPLHGTLLELRNIEDALKCIMEYDEKGFSGAFERYEIQIMYDNNDKVTGSFNNKENAIDFLRNYQIPSVSGKQGR
jgi:uncharacterized protein YqgV (UPF0045/DUF77 family)